ncbi:MAG: Ni/Fe-hydrogenase, b-type cytochrome subunit [Gemmatimonadota bacterium]
MSAPPDSQLPPSRLHPRFHLGKDMDSPSGTYRWVSIWGAPLRIMHWIAALSIVILAVTGLYIGKPYFITSGETSSHYLMGWMRFIHFTAAAFLVMTGIVRVYWLFAGNRFERLPALFPIRPRDYVNMYRQVKFYLMIQPEKAPRYIGHNPLQQMSYTGMYVAGVVVTITGFILYGQFNPGGMIFHLFAWIAPLVGGIQIVRLVHHVTTWAFLIFIPIHVYLAMRADLLERAGVVSSIVTGGRFVDTTHHHVDD